MMACGGKIVNKEVNYKKQLKVLAIGNSFSVDAMEFLYQIANNYGVEKIILGNLYIPGASIHDHILQIEKNDSGYIYFKNTGGTWAETYDSKLVEGIQDELWDIITFQEASGYSGVKKHYEEELDYLIDYVLKNKTNKESLLLWHMTWAYQQDSTHGGFAFYGKDQMTMYQAICNTVNEQINSRHEFSYVIPSGTTIQNLRTTYLGDTLTIDGFHLSQNLGRFAAGLCWFHKITGFPIDQITYCPNKVTKKDLKLIIKAVNMAVLNPFEVTKL